MSKGQNGLERPACVWPAPAGSCQPAPTHTLLTTAVARSGDQVVFHLLPGDAFSLSCKLIELAQSSSMMLIDGGAARI